jgi:uncharacterized protein (DUF4415 family)
MAGKGIKEFDPVHAAANGYTKEDWDAVESPELTDEELAHPMSFAEAFPDLAASIRRDRGRPKLDAPKEAVTLRLEPSTVERFKASGSDWRARMAAVLEKAKV